MLQRGGWVHPGDGAIGVVLTLPDRDSALHLLDEEAAGGECLITVRRRGHDRHRRIADGDEIAILPPLAGG